MPAAEHGHRFRRWQSAVTSESAAILSSWLDRLQAIAEEGKRRGEVRPDVDSAELAMLIVSTLEGSFMICRLQKNDGPLDLACHHLEEYLETKVRARQAKAGVDKS